MRQSERDRHGRDVYQRIFGQVSNAGELRQAIAMAVSELRAAMEKDPNPAVTLAHIRNLEDLEPGALARAYMLAERSGIYWPSPGQIRELAGGSAEQKAAEGLERVFAHLEKYDPAGRKKGGAVSFGDDGTGRRVLLAAEPPTQAVAPALPLEIQKTLAAVGGGSERHGLLYIQQHPRVRGWEDAAGEPATKLAERIERQWSRCYRQALHEEQEMQATSGRTE